MTCIVGVPVEGGVIIGGDSASVGGMFLELSANEKVFRRGPFVMGFCGSFRMGQLLRYKFKTPKHIKGVEDVEYMTTAFIDAVRVCFAKGGWRKMLDGREEGGNFLVGYHDLVYEIQEDFQVSMSASGYMSTGCGFEIALGALHATERSRSAPVQRVRRALEAAEQFSAGVRGPFVIIDSRDEEKR